VSFYEVHRQITALGVACSIIAPALTPRRPGECIKTDRRDATELARLFRAGELTAVHLPDESEMACAISSAASTTSVAMGSAGGIACSSSDVFAPRVGSKLDEDVSPAVACDAVVGRPVRAETQNRHHGETGRSAPDEP